MSAASSGAEKADCASCAICSQLPPALREAMRRAIDELPLSKQVCDKCLRAFWVTLWANRLAAGLKRSR